MFCLSVIKVLIPHVSFYISLTCHRKRWQPYPPTWCNKVVAVACNATFVVVQKAAATMRSSAPKVIHLVDPSYITINWLLLRCMDASIFRAPSAAIRTPELRAAVYFGTVYCESKGDPDLSSVVSCLYTFVYSRGHFNHDRSPRSDQSWKSIFASSMQLVAKGRAPARKMIPLCG